MGLRTGGLVILALLGCAVWITLAESKHEPDPVTVDQPAPAPDPKPAAESHSAVNQQSVDTVTVRGKKIQVNVTTADEAFEVLKQSDETAPAVTSESPIMPGGMVVVHTYQIAGQTLTFEFARDTESGPYMVKGILATP
jgi:hypothetical protein